MAGRWPQRQGIGNGQRRLLMNSGPMDYDSNETERSHKYTLNGIVTSRSQAAGEGIHIAKAKNRAEIIRKAAAVFNQRGY